MESTNLVELVKNVFNEDTLNHAAIQLQEKKGNLEKALAGFIPAVLLRLEAKGTSDRSTVLSAVVHTSKEILGEQSDISEGIKQAISDDADPNGVTVVEQVDSILNELFSDRKDSVSQVVTSFAGLKPSSGLRLLSVTAPATILALYYKGQQEDSVKPHQAFLQLVHQKESIINQVPAGLNLAEPLGLNNLSNVDQEPRIPRVSDDAEQREPHKVSILQWVIILVLSFGILTGFYFGCGSNRAGVTMELPPAGTTTSTPATNNQ